MYDFRYPVQGGSIVANLQLTSNLRKYRKAFGYTQDRLSARLNITRQTYSNYERSNRIPDLDLLIKLCDIYGITLEQLILQPFNQNYVIREDPSYAHTLAVDEKTNDVLYITRSEMELILQYRESSEETRRIIRKILEVS